MSALLSIRDLSVAYEKRRVITAVSGEISHGELVCIAGRNGAGKSTLLRATAGLLQPCEGSVSRFGSDDTRGLAKRMAFVPQTYDLAFPFRVQEVVLMGRYPHAKGMLGLENDDDVSRALAAMEQCEVRELAERRFHQLSGGEQRRVLLAQALCQEAELILLDEPTAALDPGHAVSFFQTLQGLCAARVGALVVTHDLNLAARFASRLWLLHDGQLVADDAPSAVLASSALQDAFALPLHVGELPDGQPFVVPA